MRTFQAAASVAVAVLVFGCFLPARAALFSLSGINDQAVSAANDLIPTPNPSFQALVPGGGVIGDPGMSGLFSSSGATLSTTGGNVTITYDYIGSFAEATNIFNTPGGSFQNTGVGERGGGDSTPQAAITVVQALSGPVDFGFSTNLGSGSSVSNISGNNPVGAGLISYLMSYLEPDGGNGDWKLTSDPTDVVLILFDDAGRGPDSNDFDDLGVVAIATPLPASLPIFASALGGLVLLVWRRKMKGQAAGESAQRH